MFLLLLLMSLRLFRLVVFMRFMLSEGFIDSDTLVFSLTFGLLALNSFVMSEMLQIFCMVVRFVGLGLRGTVELFFVMKEEF